MFRKVFIYYFLLGGDRVERDVSGWLGTKAKWEEERNRRENSLNMQLVDGKEDCRVRVKLSKGTSVRN